MCRRCDPTGGCLPRHARRMVRRPAGAGCRRAGPRAVRVDRPDGASRGRSSLLFAVSCWQYTTPDALAKTQEGCNLNATTGGRTRTTGGRTMSQYNPQAVMTREMLDRFRMSFESDPVNRLAQDAVTRVSVHTAVLNHEAATGMDHTFSVMLPSNEATAQEKSGRCWLFSGLNTFRTEAMKRLDVDKFELSQSYLMFWDKLEKASYFLESILSTLSEPIDGRLLMHLLHNPFQDGGQWDMFCALVAKYGVVPKTVMPETESSSNSGVMNAVITAKLREYAADLRRMAGTGD